MPVSRPLTKPLFKKLFLKALHEHKRPGGTFTSSGWSIGQILTSTIPHIFSLGKLTDYEIALGRRAVYELEHDEYLWPDRTQSSSEFKELTPKGLRAVEHELQDMQLPSIDIDQVLTMGPIRERVRDDYISGEFESAVLKAFKMVEEAVRDKSGLTPNEHGRDLFAKAFSKSNPLLKHPELLPVFWSTQMEGPSTLVC